MKPPIKNVIVLAPVSVTKGATQTAIIDCRGFEWLILTVGVTAADVDLNNMPKATLAHSDTTDATDFSDLPEMVAGDTATKHGNAKRNNPEGAYDATFGVDLRGCKRYLQLAVSPHATHTIWAMAILFGPELLRLTEADIEYLNEW